MPDTAMSDLWEDIRTSFVRQGWRHLAEAAEEVRQTWLLKEAGLADVTFQGKPIFPPGPFTGVFSPDPGASTETLPQAPLPRRREVK